MIASTPCPELPAYRQLTSGQLAVADAESLLRHLETCDACAGKLQSLPASDSLIEWIRQAKSSTPSSDEKQLAPLMQRLIQLGKPAAMVTFSCTACRKPLRVKAEAAGKKVKCPHCGQVILAAAASPPTPAETVETAVLPPVSSSLTATVANLPPSSREQELCAFLSPSQAPDEIGRLGSYRVLKVLGAGGMGVVFRAEDPQLQRIVALKAMLPVLAANEAARQRFFREARLAASLKHDHVVTIHQVSEDRGAPFLAMEFLEGESLEDRLKREGKLPLPEVLRIGREIADGLQAAHEHGLIHRDIKPANIWLEGKRGRVKILDFGLARLSGDDVHLTQSGAIVGTPAYMPPEQARGEAVDPRCDLYSLGCVLYRLCTGELPFKGENTMSLLLALAIEQPKSPRQINPDVPPALAELILRLLAKKPADRPAAASEVADALQDIASAKAPVPEVARVPAPPRRRRKLLAVAAAAAFLLAILATVIVIHLGRPDEGTVTIETVDPDVELVFRSGGRDVTVRDKKNGDEIKLPLGSYQVALKGGKDGLKLETDHFTLKSGKRVLVKVTRQAGEKPAAARTDVPPPVQIPEPPPLAEWLKGRKVLTVSQDGKGQFKTIKEALDALKPHQVVKVLDRGPYREVLHGSLPEDTGLISERQSVLELAEWRPSVEGWKLGHELKIQGGFRLSGLRLLSPPRQGHGELLRWLRASDLVIEDCNFGYTKPMAFGQAVAFSQAESPPNPKPIFVRNCFFDAVLLATGVKEQILVVERNYFRNAFFIAGGPRLQTIRIRHNVFEFTQNTGWHTCRFMGLKEVQALEISNNTAVVTESHPMVSLMNTAPKQGITVRNNIAYSPLELVGGAFQLRKDALKNWHVDHNSYSRPGSLPESPTDVVSDPPYLSLDAANADYLRVPADSLLAKGGAGGAWPSYIGAFPPGPAPKEGDWFTRLRQRWDNAAPAVKPLSPPTRIPEPPPLTEWLKDRKILTVSQDGKGQFKTIKEALDALKPHQVVKVLDRGPYREFLRHKKLPEDTGLVSEQKTVIEIPGWRNGEYGLNDYSPGHGLTPLAGFRLSGLRFLAPPLKKWGEILHIYSVSDIVIEDCHFSGDISGGAHVPGLEFGFDDGNPNPEPVFVRDCFFHNITISLAGESGRAPPLVVEHNYFKNGGIATAGSLFTSFLVRHNVIEFPRSPVYLQGLKELGGRIEISNNTAVIATNRWILSFNRTAPRQGVFCRNNIAGASVYLDHEASAMRAEAIKNWQVDHNCYTERKSLPQSPSDVLAEPQFLSVDPSHPDYLRIPADSPQAKGGAGGDWPSYIGALPPGPAPKEGDWFTRLRQRWDNAAPAVKPLSPPTQIPEPPPLTEWLKGRKILTVSQDGKGQFKTIQTALDALKPHEVIQVLDRGPYHERLELNNVPQDSGLISEVKTVLELRELQRIQGWREGGKDVYKGHLFADTDGFRLSGFHFILPSVDELTKLPGGFVGQGIRVNRPGGFVLENCKIQEPDNRADWSSLFLGFFERGSTKPTCVRDCIIEGKFGVSSANKDTSASVLIEHNYVKNSGKGTYLVLLSGPGGYGVVTIRHNLLDGSAYAVLFMPELKHVKTLDVHNNILSSSSGGSPVGIAKMPRGAVRVHNNLSLRPGLLVFDSGKEKQQVEAIFRTWQVGHNSYPRLFAAEETDSLQFPPGSGDVIGRTEFLSHDPHHADYLRIPVDSQLAKGGAGGAWPSYIGALPPGPAPKEGDWFTRLREKWRKDKSAANKKP